MRLGSLLESLLGTFRGNRPEVIEQCVVSSINILEETINCMPSFGEGTTVVILTCTNHMVKDYSITTSTRYTHTP